jgi:hypothetical protein
MSGSIDETHTFTYRGKSVTVSGIDGGFHVKDLPSGGCVDVLRMIYNWRVVRSQRHPTTGEHMFMDRGWCYQGTGLKTLLTAVFAADEWDGADSTEPGYGWIKRVL